MAEDRGPRDDGTDSDESVDDGSEDGHIQGFRVLVNRLDSAPADKRQGPRYPDPAKSHRRREKRPFFDGRCNACGRYGHQATQCDFLAMFSYMKENWTNKDPKVAKELERNWTERNSRYLDNERRTPTRVSMAYCYNCDVPPEALKDEIDWSFFSGTAPEDERA